MAEAGFQLKIMRQFGGRHHIHQEVELVYVMAGQLTADLVSEKYVLAKDDIIIINSNRRHGMTGDKDTVACFIKISYALLHNMADRNGCLFYCNSTLESGSKYEKFRYVVGELLSEYCVDYQKMNYMKISCFYKVLHYMVNYFRVSHGAMAGSETSGKIDRALNYINEHYGQKLSLDEMADYMYMAPSSFSRFFKKAAGMNFVEYVNNVRLHYAIEDMMGSERSMTQIALDHGFSNVSVFNKVFKKTYAMSPSEYKAKQKEYQEKEAQEEENGHLEAYLEEYRQKTRMVVVKEQKIKVQNIIADAKCSTAIRNPWSRAVNLGRIAQMLSAEYQKQIAFVKQELGIEYGRVWGIFSLESRLYVGHGAKKLNFHYMDNVLDFLTEQKIKPIIFLEDNPINLIKEINEYVYEEPQAPFETMEECLAVLR